MSRFRAIGRWAAVSVLLVIGCAPWQSAAATPAPRTEAIKERARLAKRIAAILRSPTLKKATVGVEIVEAKSGARVYGVYEQNAEKRLLIASNVKLFTTAAALEILGKDYQFHTSLHARGKVYARGAVHGSFPLELAGDLILKASGDPNLSGRFEPGITAVFDRLAAAVRKAKIGLIRGNLIIDDTVFDRRFVHPTWPKGQRVRWYSAQVAGLSLNDNCIDLTIRPGKKVGRLARVSFAPATKTITIVNTVKTVKKKAKGAVTISRKEGTNIVVVRGTVRINAKARTRYVTVHDPSTFAGSVLLAALRRAGVAVKGRVVIAPRPVDLTRKGYRKLAEHKSSLLRSIGVANGRSQNFYAEQILKTLGHEQSKKKPPPKKGVKVKPERGSFENGTAAVKAFLKKVGLKDGYAMVDGSGFSRGNRFSANDIRRLLLYMYRSKNGAIFRNSLAIPGGSGSLRNRLKGPVCKGRVWAKTGTLFAVSSLSGYAVAADGKMYIFSIVVNGTSAATARQVQDRIVTALARHGSK